MSDKSAQVHTGCMVMLSQFADPFEALPCEHAAETPLVVQDIILVCDSANLKFRVATSSKAILERARDKWGPGMITDNEGYEVTDESPVLVTDQYEYQRASASKTSVLKGKLVARWHISITGGAFKHSFGSGFML